MSVVQLVDVKAQLNVTFDDDDVLIQSKIDAAEAYLEQFTGRAFLTQTRTVYFDGFCRRLELPVMPVQSITSITYLDQNWTEQTLGAGSYVAVPLNSGDNPTYLYPASGTCWPCTAPAKSAVTVTLQAGYSDDATNVPLPLFEAIKQLVAHLYENREAVLIGSTAGDLPFGFADLITRYRTWSF